ncbi:reverse transcriptase-like protein [Elysia marginata]|uniref:Reverse transcriptase-like protein n=1 Tax=Elysia marginata TaxID=1093978 RepID=A0AAV4FE24_9GAST|nr:reverse transcriptase-like protein [Elysia marginata]
MTIHLMHMLSTSTWKITSYALPASMSHLLKKATLMIIESKILNQRFSHQEKNCLILGDLNAHSPTWDQWQPRNSIGELIEDFVVDKDLTIINEGSATFISPATGGSSAPDISICGADIAPKITWTVYPATIGSDHHRISMDIKVHGPKGQNKPKKNMAYKKANWDTFQRQIDITLSNPQTNIDPNRTLTK